MVTEQLKPNTMIQQTDKTEFAYIDSVKGINLVFMLSKGKLDEAEKFKTFLLQAVMDITQWIDKQKPNA